MTTSAANRVTPSADVTPDAVVQLAAQEGIVAEAKLGLPRDTAAWEKDLRQLEKYDDDLKGWWTTGEQLPTQDILALVPITRATKFVDRLREGLESKKLRFDRRLAVVGFFKQSGVKDFITLKKEWGDLTNADFSERLRQSKAIAFDVLILHYQKKFIDSPPPMPYLLQIVWDFNFTAYAARAQGTGERSAAVTFEVSVTTLTKEIQDYFGFRSTGPRSPEIPKRAWVKKTLDALVEFRLATRVDDERYVIEYKRTRRDTLLKFGSLCHQLQEKQNAKRDEMSMHLPGIDWQDPGSGT